MIFRKQNIEIDEWIGKKKLKQETQHKTYTQLSSKAHSYTYKHTHAIFDASIR